LKTELFITDSGKMAKDTGRVYRSGKMDLTMRDIGKKTRLMERDA